MRFHYDPRAAALATAGDIRDARLVVESMPVQCSGGLVFDADRESLQRMGDLVDGLPGDHVLRWRMADNSERELSVDQIRAYLAEIRKARALRMVVVHQEYRALRESPATTLRDLDDWVAGYRVGLEAEPK